MGTEPQRSEATPLIHIFWGLVCVFCLAAGLLVGRSLTEQAAPPPEDTGPSMSMNATAIVVVCTRVLDGDTFDVDWGEEGFRVRLLGIDCPETKNNKKLREQAEQLNLDPASVLQYGKIARSTTESWLLNNQITLLFPSGRIERGSFGRLLAYAELNGSDIGEKLLDGGNAFFRDSDHQRRDHYELLEAKARKKKLGIWRSTQ